MCIGLEVVEGLDMRCFSGATVLDILLMITSGTLPPHLFWSVDFVFINLGTNNVGRGHWATYRFLPDMRTLVGHLMYINPRLRIVIGGTHLARWLTLSTQVNKSQIKLK